MSISPEQAKAIVQAVTVDIWNNPEKRKRLALMETYCAAEMKAYAPDGSVTVGYEDCDGAYDKLHADGRADWKFRVEGELWMNANCLMQRWVFGISESGWKGWDVIMLDGENKVASLYGLVEGMHSHSL